LLWPDFRAATSYAFTVTRAPLVGGIGNDRDYYTAPQSTTQIPDLSVTIANAGAAAWSAWRDDFIIRGNSGDAQEKNGSLEILHPNLTTVLLPLQLAHVGIKRLAVLPTGDGRPELFRAELYCEEISIASSPVTGATTPATPTPAATTPAATTPAETAPAPTTEPPPSAPTDPKTPAEDPKKTPAAEVPPKDGGKTPAPSSSEATANPEDKGSRDPADFPRAGGTTRTQYSAERQKDFLRETAKYTARAKADEIMAFYEKRLGGSGWKEVSRYENDNGNKGAHQITTIWADKNRSASMTFMDTDTGIVEIQIVVQSDPK
jgi:hypothetical protein